MTATLHWFAFTTASNGERRAEGELEPYAAATKLPVGVRETPRKGKAPPRRRTWPLMVGYVFAGFETPRQVVAVMERLAVLRDAQVTTALRRVVATRAGTPMELRADRDGRAWYDAMDYSRVLLADDDVRPLSWGEKDTVRITTGAFAGFTGPVSRVDGERAKVVVQMFQSLMDVDISVRDAVLHARHRPAPPKDRFAIGDAVKVIDGPFDSFPGTVDSIDEDTGTLRVTVMIFGRASPVDLAPKQLAFAKRTR